MAKKVQEQGVHFFIVEDGKPRYFIHLTLRLLQDRTGLYGLCPEVGVGTGYCDDQTGTREELLGLVRLHLSGPGLHEYLARCELPLYPIPDLLQLDDDDNVALAEPVANASPSYVVA